MATSKWRSGWSPPRGFRVHPDGDGVISEHGQRRDVALLVISGATGFVAHATDKTAAGATSENLIADFLLDDTGPRLPRIRIALCTPVPGAIYVWKIAGRLQPTEFDTTLPILAGVAGSVYAVLKTRES